MHGGHNYTIDLVGNLSDGNTSDSKQFQLEIRAGNDDFKVVNTAPTIDLATTYRLERYYDADGNLIGEIDSIIYLGVIVDKEGDLFETELTSPQGVDSFAFD